MNTLLYMPVDNGSSDDEKAGCFKEQERKYYCHLLYDYLSGINQFFGISKILEEIGLANLNPFYKIAYICCNDAGTENLKDIKHMIGRQLRTAGIVFISFYSESGKLIFIANLKVHQDIPCDHIFFEQVMNSVIKLNCGISTSMEGVQLLRELYIQADDALKESMFKGIKFCQYDEITKNPDLIINVGDHIKLLDFFSRGLLNEMHKHIDTIFTKLVNSGISAKDTISMLFNMINYLYINLSSIYKDICNIEKVRASLESANSILNMKMIVMGAIDGMHTSSLEKNKMDYSNHIINYMINEIRTHYNTKITLYRLADKLAMNYSYISGLFTKNVGISFQEYLLGFRLDKARELILSGEYRMNEISEKCGFYDAHFFSKAFKKRFSMAPGEYSKINIKESSKYYPH